MIRVELRDVEIPDWYLKDRKIGRHTRKLNGETFVSPRVVLPSAYNDLVGKSYYLLEAQGLVEIEDWRHKKIEGKVLIILLPESEEEDFDDFEEEDFDAGED